MSIKGDSISIDYAPSTRGIPLNIFLSAAGARKNMSVRYTPSARLHNLFIPCTSVANTGIYQVHIHGYTHNTPRTQGVRSPCVLASTHKYTARTHLYNHIRHCTLYHACTTHYVLVISRWLQSSEYSLSPSLLKRAAQFSVCSCGKAWCNSSSWCWSYSPSLQVIFAGLAEKISYSYIVVDAIDPCQGCAPYRICSQ